MVVRPENVRNIEDMSEKIWHTVSSYSVLRIITD
jgi:hypothetical protein